MKTVAIDIRLIGKNRTGDEAVFRNLTCELVRQGTDMRFLLLTDRGDEVTMHAIRSALGIAGPLPENVEIRVLPAHGKICWNAFAVPAFLMQERVDLFHTQYILPVFVPRRTRVVVHIHDVSFRAYPSYIGAIDRVFLSAFIPRTMRRADLLVVPSRFTKEEVVGRFGVGPQRIVVVPNAIDPSFLPVPSTDDISRVRSTYDLPETFILSVGTMQPRKNIPLLIRAFAQVRKAIPGLRLVLVGGKNGPHYDRRIGEAIGEECLTNDVIFPGYVRQEDMPALYASASVLVFPSLYEGFGIPLLESFSAGTPVAASDIGPFREVGVQAASYFDPTDVAACADSVYTLLIDQNARARHERLGKERLGAYSWSESARSLLASYRSLLGISHES